VKDFLDQEFGPGDTIVYPAASGRSINMVAATVISINEKGTVRVQPFEGARWKRSSRIRYIDTRTGKGIDPWLDEHIKQPPHRRHKMTGLKLTWEEWHRLPFLQQQDFEYVRVTLKDYVGTVDDGPAPVNLKVTKNIVKVAP
jgi:hypothetical protein